MQLARLILDDLSPPQAPVDTSDGWSDDGLADLADFSAQHAWRPQADRPGTP